MRQAIKSPSLQLWLPDDPELATRETLKHMRKLVWDGVRLPAVRDHANLILSGVPGKAWRWQMNQIFNWVRDNITYRLDPNGLETIQRADVTLQLGYGDCDDFCILLSTLLECCGYWTCFRALGFAEPGQYSHVILMAQLEGETPLLQMDATEPQQMGWAPPGWTCEMLAPMS